MASSRRRKPRRKRVGRVSLYHHHGAWWVYYRDGQQQVRRRIGEDETLADQVAAQVNAQLATAAPTMFSFTPLTVPELCRRFLDDHEHVQRSSLATIRRYGSALQHLEQFATKAGGNPPAHDIQADQFVRYLRSSKIAPNGHPHTKRRALRDKGVRFILETCRSLFGWAAKKRHMPPYGQNPFAGLGGKRCRIEDAKPIFVFDADTELVFLNTANDWAFPVHFTLAKTGLRPGELIHLLIEDLDLDAGWMQVREKPELGWRIKSRRERAVPLIDELVAVLRRVVGQRTSGVVFQREQFEPGRGSLATSNRAGLARAVAQRIEKTERETDQTLSREARAKIAGTVWRDAGAVKADQIRLSFIRTARAAGLQEATCPKSWRHSFATLLQDANVDPLIRQITLGHTPVGSIEGALGMTTLYTHTRPTTQRREVLRALRLWPQSLELGQQFANRTRS